MTYTYTETTTRTASIHTSPARQQFIAVGGGVERRLSYRAMTEAEIREWAMATAFRPDLPGYYPYPERRWWEFWR